jgi:hypothetical protein
MHAGFDPVTNLHKSSAVSIPARLGARPFTSDDFTNRTKAGSRHRRIALTSEGLLLVSIDNPTWLAVPQRR